MSEDKVDGTTPGHYVGIGASAGGLEALEQFFQNLPLGSGLAFIVIQHLSPDYKSMMVELLSKKTQLHVLRAEEGMVVEKETIYLIPPKKNLTIFHGKLLLSDLPPHDRWINLPIDIFLRSLAEDQGDRSVAIILSGTGSDGSRGVRAVKESGGMIMVQDDKDARFDGMPRSAASTGIADFILPVAEMPNKLLAYVKYPFLTKRDSQEQLIRSDDGLNAVFSLLRAKTKVDFTFYKPSTVIRRIERRMNVNQMDDLQSYIKMLSANSRELLTLYREILIGVTSFFRDREAFDCLRETVLPELRGAVGERGGLRFWVAGCSTGEEAYSLAILLQELLDKAETQMVKIFATDVDSDAIMFASSGIYPKSIAADVGPTLLSKYFHNEGDNYRVTRQIREMVVFAQQNLVKDPPFTNIDMVSCRNLLIYLQPVLQKTAMEMFNFSLKEGGILFLGPSETTGEMGSFFTTVNNRWRIYASKGRRNLRPDRPEALLRYSREVVHPRVPQLSIEGGRRSMEQERQLSEWLLRTLSPDIVPLTVVINEDLEVVYTVGDTRELFHLPSGMMDHDIRRMVKKEIAIPLAIGVQKAAKEGREVVYSNIRIDGRAGSRMMQLCIRPMPTRKSGPGYMAIVFSEMHSGTEPDDGQEGRTYDYSRETEQRIIDLEQELQFTKENLQATIEELETSNEELQATNEELLASNEELQSTNEELQSVNEELYTVNSEHQRKIMELTELNNDIDNLLTSTEIGTIFLDEELRVRKFTPHAQMVFNIIESDIGRPFAHLTHRLEDFPLQDEARKVLAGTRTSDHKVRSKDGRWFFLRYLPYHIAPQAFSGVVITLLDITDLVDVETALRQSEEQLGYAEKAASFASWQWERETDRLSLSPQFERMIGGHNHLETRSLEAFLACIHPEDRARVEQALEQAAAEDEDLTVVYRLLRKDGTFFQVKQVGVASGKMHGKGSRLTGIVKQVDGAKGDPVTAQKIPGRAELHPGEQVSLAECLVIIDDTGKILSVNSGVEQLLGYGENELLGKSVAVLMPSPHREQHDEYMMRYRQTGEAHIINKGRKVEALRADGSHIELQLSVGEVKAGERSLFIGHLAKAPEIADE